MTEREAAQAYLKEALELPAYYGLNLDALYDCMTSADDLELVLDQTEAAGDYYEKVLQVLEDAAEENPGLSLVIRD